MFPFRLPLFLILFFPLAEIFAFIEIGSRIGVWQTVLWVILAAVVGFLLLRLQGMSTLMRIQASLIRGEPPARALLDGALLFISAILLIIPGFISDAIAILLMLPPVRWLLARMLMSRAVIFSRGYTSRPPHDSTIEGEYQREDDLSSSRLPRQ